MSAPESTEELGKLYGEEYYRTGCGPVPYTRSEPQWAGFFGGIADQTIRALHPKRVLDVGCALGFLVEAFWDRGVEAWGIDVSPYAIANVRRDMQPYCKVASAADGIEGSYDLITCIEVLEHMPEEQGLSAIHNLTQATATILFSSTPYDLSEPTHFNVKPIVSWLRFFRSTGFRRTWSSMPASCAAMPCCSAAGPIRFPMKSCVYSRNFCTGVIRWKPRRPDQ